MRRMIRQQEAGFISVTEVLFALGMGVIVTFALTVLFIAMVRGTAAISIQTDLQTSTTLVMDQIMRDARDAVALEGTRIVDATLYTSTNPGATLILKLPSVAASTGQLIDINSTYDYVIYTFQPNGAVWEFRRIVDANAASRRAVDNGIVRLISRSVSAVTFARNATNTAVTISLTGQRTEGNAVQQVDLRSEAVLRNT